MKDVATGIRDLCDLGLKATTLSSKEVEPGDILVTKTGSNPLSKMIAGLDGWWCHTAVSLGGDQIAHANARGITLGSIDELIDGYEQGVAAARPAYDAADRQQAADWARSKTTEPSSYSSTDLGVAYSLLRRASKQPGIDELMALTENEAIGGPRHPVDPPFESTCSGFAYQSYWLGAGVRLPIKPAPGIWVTEDDRIWVPDKDDLLRALLCEDGYVDEDVSVRNELSQIARLLRIGLEGTVSAVRALQSDEPVPIEVAVTPSDLWMSCDAADRWFISNADAAHVASERC